MFSFLQNPNQPSRINNQKLFDHFMFLLVYKAFAPIEAIIEMLFCALAFQFTNEFEFHLMSRAISISNNELYLPVRAQNYVTKKLLITR